MILLFDVGNTSCKWRLMSDDLLICSGRDLVVGDVNFPALIHSNLSRLSFVERLRVVVSSVASDEQNVQLGEYLQSTLGVYAEFVVVLRDFVGVRAAYAELANLGVDRWLAMVAAYTEFKSSCLVVDAGTAITIDVLAGDGQHLGGMIAPGLNLVGGTLYSKTAKVRFDGVNFSPRSNLGKSTKECVNLGVSMMIDGFVASALNRWCTETSVVIWSGGDGKKLFEECRHEGGGAQCIRESLVFDGLRIWSEIAAF